MLTDDLCRLMKGFKGLVRNRRYIDGCIARGYTLREASLYSMESLSTDGDGTHKHTRKAFLDDDEEFADEMPLTKARPVTLTDIQFAQVRKWILSKYVGLDAWERYLLNVYFLYVSILLYHFAS